MTLSPSDLYAERQKRVADAVALRVPDRVPFTPFVHFYPATYSGVSKKDLMFDYGKLAEVYKSLILDLEPDMYNHLFPTTALGPLMDILQAQIFQWPGGVLADNRPYQYVEGEYMSADEYDDFIFDPTDFMLRIFLPRAYKSLEGFKELPYWPSLFYTRFMSALASIGKPGVMAAAAKLGQAADEAAKMGEAGSRFMQEMKDLGYGAQFGGVAYAPFDFIGDLFRGTRGIYIDMRRVPDKLHEAMEKTQKIMTRGALATCKASGVPYVFIPLHKGNDRVMGQEQFKSFYWPSLRQLIVNLIDLDLVPVVFWESECTKRLEVIQDIPRGKAIYMFESSDIFKAKEILGDTVCIRGNVPASLMCVGSPDEVTAYCRKLIEVVGKNGGFLLDGGVGIPDEAKLENVKAMAKATREYGRYA